MATESAPLPFPNWQQLYQQAMLELDSSKLPSAINKANDAILEQIEHIDATHPDELPLLNDALNGLRVLRREYERSSKEYGQLRSRKLG